jgi:hypothetical protein
MYDAREKLLRDQRWMIKSSLKQGLEKVARRDKTAPKDSRVGSVQRRTVDSQGPAQLTALASELGNQISKNPRR